MNNTWQSLGGPYINSEVQVVSWGTDPLRIDLFAQAAGPSIYHDVYNGTWNNWELLPIGCPTPSPCFDTFTAISLGFNNLIVFALGATGNPYQTSWNGTQWSNWVMIDPNGVYVGQPTAVVWGSGNRIELFVFGTYNALCQLTWDSTGGWSFPPAGITPGINEPLTFSAVAAIGWPNFVDVFVVGLNRTLLHNQWNGSDWWPTWQDLGGGYLASQPTVVSNSDGRIDIFAVGQDHSVIHLSGNADGNWNTWESLNWTASSIVGACSPAANQLNVFVVGNDSACWLSNYNGSNWSSWVSVGGTFTLPLNGLCLQNNSVELFGVGPDSVCSNAAVPAPTGTFIPTASNARNSTITNSAAASGGGTGSTDVKTAAIVGGILGAVLLASLVVILYVLKKRKASYKEVMPNGTTNEQLGGRIMYDVPKAETQ